ncbi:ornithine decarboxylase antizyme 3 isoform 2-T4 [Anomaloglossus baeobatrachus]|uniref:ornithine decarboxylase antizyme 3 isoform X2 n=1 Tax=Anomaloglossus baeobatrachus TaxID=238106 RepID=UPI003F4FF047
MSLAAILEFVEMKLDAIWVLVGVNKELAARGRLLRAFSFIGFDIVRPAQHQWFPTCTDNVILVYSLDGAAAQEGINAPNKEKQKYTVQ